jgi:hypothetical protein
LRLTIKSHGEYALPAADQTTLSRTVFCKAILPSPNRGGDGGGAKKPDFENTLPGAKNHLNFYQYGYMMDMPPLEIK